MYQISVFSIQIPKPPKECSAYGNKSILILQHNGRELPAESVLGDEFVMPAFVNPDVPVKRKTFRKCITNQPKEGTSEQLKELSTNSMLQYAKV